MVIEIFNERLRANGGDYIEALHTYRRTLSGNCTLKDQGE